jgi:hypothetical protein
VPEVVLFPNTAAPSSAGTPQVPQTFPGFNVPGLFGVNRTQIATPISTAFGPSGVTGFPGGIIKPSAPVSTPALSTFQQRFLKYQIGGTVNLGDSGLFLDAGFLGDTIRGKNIAPSDATHAGGYLGLGLRY